MKLGEPYEMPSMPVDGIDPVKVAEAIDKVLNMPDQGKVLLYSCKDL